MSSVLLTAIQTTELSSKTGYVTGAVIALIILVYLIYTMVKPEKF